MNDFKLIIDKCVEILLIEIPVLGHYFSMLSIFLALAVLSICISFVVWLFNR